MAGDTSSYEVRGKVICRKEMLNANNKTEISVIAYRKIPNEKSHKKLITCDQEE